MEFWKNGLLPFDPAKITTDYVVGEDGTEYPNFERVLLRKSAKYHHNCHIRYLPYNLASKKKSLRSKNKKDEAGKSSAFFLSSMGSNSCTSQVKQFQILFALYAVTMMSLRTFMMLGHFIRLNQN